MSGEGSLAETTPHGRPDPGPRVATDQNADVPVRLVSGHATPEELSALIAVFAVLSSEGDDEGDDDTDQTGRPRAGGDAFSWSRWGSPSRQVRRTHPHGPGGWRRSASPPADTSTPPAG